MRIQNKLDQLKASGTILNWQLVNVDDTGSPNRTSKFRNSERLIITFPNGETLTLGTFCSGSLENSGFTAE
jgi:hypothetical protein